MDSITIREMREDDCPRASRLQCASFEYGALRAGYSAAQIASYCRDRGSQEAIRAQFRKYDCLVACSGGQTVGVVGVEENELVKLYVDPAHLRQGIGSALFDSASDIVAKAGFQEMWLGTIFPGAIPFYIAMGMAESGRKRVTSGPMVGAESILLKKTHLAE